MRLTSELNLGTVKNYFNSSWNFLQDIIACNFYRDADRIYRFDDSNSPCLSAENWKIKTAQLVIDIFLLFLFLSIIPRDINLGNVKHKRTKINRLVTQRRCRRGWHCVRSKKEYRENVEHLSILFQRNNMYFFFLFFKFDSVSFTISVVDGDANLRQTLQFDDTMNIGISRKIAPASSNPSV